MPPQHLASHNPRHASTTLPQREIFDPWNSSSTGHQRAENRMSGSTAWRESRTIRLQGQLRDGHRGGRRVPDGMCERSEEGLEKGEGQEIVRGLREKAQLGVKDFFRLGKRRESVRAAVEKKAVGSSVEKQHKGAETGRKIAEDADEDSKRLIKKQIFRNLTIYVNGSTYPFISDHKLKRLLVSHGARVSIALGRRGVTHVILGVPVGHSGAGGGLAAGKFQKEISLVRGKSVKFVSAEWAVQSIEAGKRLPEIQFAPLKIAPRNQLTMIRMLKENGRPESDHADELLTRIMDDA